MNSTNANGRKELTKSFTDNSPTDSSPNDSSLTDTSLTESFPKNISLRRKFPNTHEQSDISLTRQFSDLPSPQSDIPLTDNFFD